MQHGAILADFIKMACLASLDHPWQWEGNKPVLWRRNLTSECVRPPCNLSTISPTIFASPFASVPKVVEGWSNFFAACILCHSTLSTEEFIQQRLLSWYHPMRNDSHWLCAKLQSRHSGGKECVIAPLPPLCCRLRRVPIPSRLPSSGQQLGPPLLLDRGYRFYQFVQQFWNITRCVLTCAAVSFFSCFGCRCS